MDRSFTLLSEAWYSNPLSYTRKWERPELNRHLHGFQAMQWHISHLSQHISRVL